MKLIGSMPFAFTAHIISWINMELKKRQHPIPKRDLHQS